MLAPIVTIATIPATGSISPGVALPAPGLYAIEIDGPWTPAPLSLQASQNHQATWLNVMLAGNEFAFDAAAACYFQLDPDDWFGITDLKVRSGTAAAPVAQAADTFIKIIGFPAAVPPIPTPEPSCTRRLVAPLSGYAGQFKSFSTLGDDVCTIDLTPQLSACDPTLTETIVSATWALSVIGPAGTADPTPADRMLTAVGIDGALISMELGNWQAGIPYILYQAFVVAITSRGNRLTAWAYIPVYSPYP